MSARASAASRLLVAGLLSVLLVGGALGGPLSSSARADSAPADPANPATPTTVTADPLPTVQINGVVWAQVVVGNTVYAAGKFTRARPAGAPAGSQEVERNNLLAYDIRTGELISSFAPNLNAQALALAASPDGSRIYVGGDFSQANGQTRYRIAAYSTATGELVSNFRPSLNARVNALAATNDALYIGGAFTAVGSTGRSRLAAVSAATGGLLPWAPVPGTGSTSGNRDGNTATSSHVLAMVATNNGSQIVAGGRFDSLNGVKATGVGALDALTGETRPFAVNQLISNQGVNSAVWSLSTDGEAVYGTGYDFYGPGNLEGSFAAEAAGGAPRWINDCHGDTYSSFPMNGALYMATHAHVCSNIGGFPEENPRINKFGTAVSLAATGTVGNATLRNGLFRGQPAPSVLPWYPDMAPGTYTGQSQAGWSVTGNDRYVVFGGEFPRVNSASQQGLVRFTLPDSAPNKVGPSNNDELTPTVASLAPGTARVAWLATHDRDNENLTYRIYRDGDTATPVYTVTQASQFWKRPTMAYTDRGLSEGSHRYRLTVSDPLGNTVTTAWTSVDVAAGSTAARPYADTVRSDGALNHWPLGEASGTKAYDHTGANDATIGGGVTLGRTGAVAGDQDTASRFSGSSNGLVAAGTRVSGPQTFAIEAWFQTTSSSGGKIVGFGNRNTGNSTTYDRHVYMDRSGRVLFGVYPGAERIVTSPARYNDGTWHHVVATLGSEGMGLYVDGQLVGSRTDATSAQSYNGFWRIGGDSTWGNNNQYFNGTIDEVAIYPTALPADRVLNHYTLGSTGTGTNVAPTAAFTSSTSDLTASFDASSSTDSDGTIATTTWTFGDGTTGAGTNTTHTYPEAGTYPVTVTVTDDAGASDERTGSVTVTAPPANVAPVASFEAAVSGLAVAVDGAGSTDSDGSVASYAWNFGNGSTGAGATASHTYAEAGTYDVTLTVTDDDGTTGTVTKPVTVTAPPVAGEAFAADDFGRTVANGFGSAGTGGTWSASGGARSVSDGVGHLQVNSAGGSSAVWLNSATGTDVALQVDLSLAAAPTGAGTYVYVVGRRTAGGHYRGVVRFLADGTVRLGLARVVSNVETTLRTVVLPGTYTPGTVLQVRLDLAGSGTTALNAKAWAAGTAEPAGWQVSATDSSASLQAPGGVGVTVYVSGSATAVPVRVDLDNLWAGPTGTAPSGQPTPPPANVAPVAPVASFEAAVSGLAVAVDGAGSTDSDGSVASYAWNFGNGSTGAGATASHTYAEAGTYDVTLTVTDDDGTTGTVTKPVTVTAPPVAGEAFAADDFGRTVANGFGSAGTGGTWSASGGARSVSDGVGHLQVNSAGGSSAVWLNSATGTDVALQVDLSLAAAPTGAGTYVYVVGRRTAGGHYRGVVRFLADGTVRLGLARVVSNVETTLRTVVLPGTYTPGTVLQVRLDLAGSGTTALNAKAWAAGTAEPAGWQVSATDSSASLQAPGGVGVTVYVSGSATAVPVRVDLDNLWAGPTGTAPRVD